MSTFPTRSPIYNRRCEETTAHLLALAATLHLGEPLAITPAELNRYAAYLGHLEDPGRAMQTFHGFTGRHLVVLEPGADPLG